MIFQFNARAVALLSVLAVAACTDAPTGARTTDFAGSPQLDVIPSAAPVKNIAYATKSAAQKLDVYTPTGTGPFPVVLWIHAGAWKSGDKALAPTAHQLLLLNSGYAVVSVNYRLSGEAIFPAQIHDVKAAVRWVRANAATYKFDKNRVGVWGHSAGAHLAALLGTSTGVSGLTDLSLGNPTQSEAVKAVVAQATPVYMLTMDQQLASNGCPKYGGVGFNAATSPASRLLGAALPSIPSTVVQASPRAHVNAGDPKFLLQHGTGDCTIPWQQGDFLHTRLLAVLGAGASTLDLFPGGKHDDVNFSSSANVARIVSFLRTAL